jgi:hypothetical protein
MILFFWLKFRFCLIYFIEIHILGDSAGTVEIHQFICTVEPLVADTVSAGGHLSIKDTNVQSQIGHFYSF